MKPPDLPRSFIAPRELDRIATEFLDQYNPDHTLPIPIEEIVEFELGLDIIPMPNLYRDFAVESWLSMDQKSIHVDQYQLERMEVRYRFTLAHEVSHLLLHADLYQRVATNTLEEWLEFQEAIDGYQRDDYEWQAYNLAGRILVPEQALIGSLRRHLERVPSSLRESMPPKDLLGTLALSICREFNVSDSVVGIRLVGDGTGFRVLED